MRISFLIVLSTVLACSSSVLLPGDVSKNRRILLPFRVDSVRFVDMRGDTTTTGMNLPLFTMKSKEWIVKPGIDPELQSEIMRLIRPASHAEGLPG